MKIPLLSTQGPTTRTVYTHARPDQTVSVGPNREAVFTFIDFIALSVHLSFQDVALNQALHNFLWRREQRTPLNKKKKKGAMASGAGWERHLRS